MTTEKTLTQKVLDHLGTREDVAKLVTKRAGFSVSRQAVGKWHKAGALPFLSADLYAGILSRAARAKGFDVMKDDLLGEVNVPDDRVPRSHAPDPDTAAA